MNKAEAGKLLEKYREKTCTEEELALLEKWYLDLKEREFDQSEEYMSLMARDIFEKLPIHDRSSKIRVFPKLAAVAAVVIAVFAGGYFYLAHRDTQTPDSNRIQPGSNKAVLILSNGKQILLNDIKTGTILTQTGVRITKSSDGKLIYSVVAESNSNSTSDRLEMNTIQTPKGGKYQVNLPDGTTVLLNAASSLRYPSRFSREKREVELTGEGYFEVAKVFKISSHGKDHMDRLPFIVKTATQRVEVLGTHFNLSSYSDEPEVRTTLLEGSVQVAALLSKKVETLKPGQQSILQGGAIEVKAADLNAEMAWKNDEFVFASNDFRAEMRKIARWYDVDIVYTDSAPSDVDLGGFISRSKNISAVLRLIELTGKVHFKIEGRRIIVTK